MDKESLVASDSSFLSSGVSSIQSSLNKLSAILSSGVSESYGSTDTQIPTQEPEVLSAAFRHLEILCDKLNMELNNLLSVGDGINSMDAELSEYSNELLSDNGIRKGINDINTYTAAVDNRVILEDEEDELETVDEGNEWYENISDLLAENGMKIDE